MSDCGCNCACTGKTGDNASRQVLTALAKAAGPCGSKDIVQATGLDKQVVGSEITALKKQGLVDSSVRCKYGITAEGRAILG